MSDFRSILSSFQEANGTSTNTSTGNGTTSRFSNSTNKRSSERRDVTTASTKNHVVAKKNDIEHLWRTSQIQSSFRAAKASATATATATAEFRGNCSNRTSKSSVSTSNNGSSSTTSNEKKEERSPIHVAICATIVSDLPHEHIWRSWSSHHRHRRRSNDNGSTSTPTSTLTSISASVHVHAKNPNAIRNGTWLKSRLIPVSHNPNWNDYRIILAMLSLAEYAIKFEPQTTHLMMVTESCIPIGTLDDLSTVIHQEGMQSSFMDVYGVESPRCTRFDEHRCFSIDGVPRDAIYKALPGWALFSRSHLEEVIYLRDRLRGGELYPLFKNVWAPEEVFFPTALALLGKLSGTNEVVRQSLMWSKWDENSRGSDRAHPIIYDGQFSRELVNEAKEMGCIFMRKWKKRLSLQHWEEIVLSAGRDGEPRNYGEFKRRVRESTSIQKQAQRKRSKFE